MQYPAIEVPDNLPDGVQKQVAYFLADSPKSGPALVEQYLRMVTSDEYRSRPMGRSDSQQYEANRTKNEPKKISKSTSKSSRTRKTD